MSTVVEDTITEEKLTDLRDSSFLFSRKIHPPL